MSLRDFFATNSWWGKILGAFFGYIIAGSPGAVFGILVGNFFDRGLASHFNNPNWIYWHEKRNTTQKIFFESIFLIIGFIAKADGRVSIQEINMARDLMAELQLSHEQKLHAMYLFNEGKKTNFNLNKTLSELHRACHNNSELLKLFMDILYRAARTDGLTAKKIAILDSVFSQLGFVPLRKQHRFYEDFGSSEPYYGTYDDTTKSGNESYQNHHTQQKNNYSSNSYNRYNYKPTSSNLDQAYALLEVNSTASKQEVKRAYRKLLSKNHPDKLIAQGLPQAMIKIANEKTQKIVKSYELICTSKGW